MNTTPAQLDLCAALEKTWNYYQSRVQSSPTQGLDALAEEFIQLKKYLGRRYLAVGDRIRFFIKFLKQRKIRMARQLTTEAVVEFSKSRAHLRTSSWLTELNAVNVFLEHLKGTGKIECNPCIFLAQRRRPTYVPYVFSHDEMLRILNRPALKSGQWAYIKHTQWTVWFMLYACGLRVSDLTKRNLKDYDREKGVLQIWKSKFGKDRLIPLHLASIKVLEDYMRRRTLRFGSPALDDPLMVNDRGKRLVAHKLSLDFRRLLRKLCMYRRDRFEHGVQYGGPRLHSLRHTFAVHRLLKWYREGAEVQKKLLLLSTYMGHSSIVHTEVYLRITSLVLREAARRFSKTWETQFPLKP